MAVSSVSSSSPALQAFTASQVSNAQPPAPTDRPDDGDADRGDTQTATPVTAKPANGAGKVIDISV
jgi:hypothetical protein